jgi:hypothetical protein
MRVDCDIEVLDTRLDTMTNYLKTYKIKEALLNPTVLA